MSENKIVRKSGKICKLPENIIPEAAEFIRETIKRIDADDGQFSASEYGHAAGTLAQGMLGVAYKSSPEEQRAKIREFALYTIQRHGKKIIPFLREELRLSLSEEDLASLD